MNEEALEAIWADMLGFLAASITDARVQWNSFEVASNIRVDTTGSAPASLGESVESISVCAEELLCALLDDSFTCDWAWHSYLIKSLNYLKVQMVDKMYSSEKTILHESFKRRAHL